MLVNALPGRMVRVGAGERFCQKQESKPSDEAHDRRLSGCLQPLGEEIYERQGEQDPGRNGSRVRPPFCPQLSAEQSQEYRAHRRSLLRATTMVIGSLRTAPHPSIRLSATGASPIDLDAVGAHLEPGASDSQKLRVERALLELGDDAARFADHVMVVILGELVSRSVAEIQSAHDAQLPEEAQSAVHGYQPDLGAPRPYLLQALMLLLRQRPQDRHALRRRLVSSAPHLPNSRPQHKPAPLANRKNFSIIGKLTAAE